ncbi:DEAD/DEAH box helicase [Tissierella sp. MSJ-40]|uniref:ATP-dependent RNA helicase DbpA n=1 Tax=Tissierella simiarum TaxID=2841534 RepID=A0ABS6EA90_9FIRM|nr:DEAD/DEAH box helicase [Tissierella simiarum]
MFYFSRIKPLLSNIYLYIKWYHIVYNIQTNRLKKERVDILNKKNFKDYNLSDEILKSVDLLGYKNLTKVQEETLPIILKGKDLVVKSQTGSGKTAAFAVPICESIYWDERSPQALVIVPTRELAMQVREEFFNIGRFKRLKIVEVYGKAPYGRQERELKERAHVVVGTPGRIIDHLERGNLRVDKIKYLVLDESDEMLNMGFLEQVENIIEKLPEERVNLLFSATMPEDIEELSKKYMNNPSYIEIESSSNTLDRIEQVRYNVEGIEKIELLKDITVVENPDNCIIFCNTRDDVNFVYNALMDENYSCDKIHGGMEQRDRTEVMEDFKMGKFRFLVATDVAARGIDVEDITHVINYDIPREVEPYIHRIGRTARKGKTGKAILLHDNYEEKYLKDILEYMGKDIKLVEPLTEEEVEKNNASFRKKMNEEREDIRIKGESLNEGILKLHINAGKKTKMRAGDVVGAICSIDGVNVEDIGIINIIDVSTFVEILNNKGDMVYKALQNTKIKGRVRNISIARR